MFTALLRSRFAELRGPQGEAGKGVHVPKPPAFHGCQSHVAQAPSVPSPLQTSCSPILASAS